MIADEPEDETEDDLFEDEPPPAAPADRWAVWRGLATYVLRRFTEGRCLRMAAGLSYTSLLAIVPLTAIAFAMLAAFPAFEGVREEAQDVLFSNFLPESASALRGYLDTFVANTSTLSTFGIVGLALTAILLLGAIEADMNAIFRVSRPRALAPRLLVFWALITLGPLLFGASFTLTTYFFAATRFMGVDVLAGPFGSLAGLAPTAILVLMLAGAYLVVPNRPVSLRAALYGGAFAGIAFSLLRQVFHWYVATFPAYQTMYGAVSVVPIFLVYMYLSWTVVLLGAVLTAALDEWRRAGGLAVLAGDRSSRRLVTALKVLSRMHQLSQDGHAASRFDLLRTAGVGDIQLETVLRALEGRRYVTETRRGRWVLSRDMGTVTLHDLYLALGLGVEDEELPTTGDAWVRRLRACLDQARQNNRQALDVSLRELLEEEPTGGIDVKAAE